MKYSAVAVALLALVLATGARAEGPGVPLLSFGIRGGVGTYVMSDMNVAINDVNDIVTDPNNFYGEVALFGSGPIGGGEVRVRVLPQVAASVTVDYLFEASSLGLEAVGQEFEEIDLHASTVPITLRVLYVARNENRPNLVYTAGGGVSYLWLGRLRTQSSQIVNVPFPETDYRTADGSGVGAQVVAGAEYFVRPWVSVGGELFYRYAKISELKYTHNDQPVRMSNGEKLSLDFSGFNASVCIRTHLF